MTTTEENDRLSQVGPETPGGELMRRYWQPFLPASRLNDQPVQKVRLLGEDLVCYKDRSGTIGLIGDRCAHRLVGMQFGIPQENGLRCPYHGWCYDETGQCTDTPLESPNSRLKDNISIGGYPVQEMGGLLFAYMGPAPAPILPPWDLLVWPNAVRQIGYTILPCNWLQCHENNYDPLHTVYLHGYDFRYQLERKGELDSIDLTKHMSYNYITRYVDGYDHLVTKRDDFGVQQAMIFLQSRGAAKDWERWTLYTVFPYLCRPSGFDSAWHTFLFSIPIDDTHTYQISYEIFLAPPGVTAPQQESIPSFEIQMPFGDGFGDVPILDTVRKQDYMMWASQGPVVDRAKEHLGAIDKSIQEYREQLAEQIALVEVGKDPLNVFWNVDEVGSCIDLDVPLNRWWDNATHDGKIDYRTLYNSALGFAEHARQHRGGEEEGVGNWLHPLVADINEQLRVLVEAQEAGANEGTVDQVATVA